MVSLLRWRLVEYRDVKMSTEVIGTASVNYTPHLYKNEDIWLEDPNSFTSLLFIGPAILRNFLLLESGSIYKDHGSRKVGRRRKYPFCLDLTEIQAFFYSIVRRKKCIEQM